jgi:hypothetical protein
MYVPTYLHTCMFNVLKNFNVCTCTYSYVRTSDLKFKSVGRHDFGQVKLYVLAIRKKTFESEGTF